MFNPIPDSSEIDSTMYTPFGKLDCSRHSTLTNRAKISLKDMAKGSFIGSFIKDYCKNVCVHI